MTQRLEQHDPAVAVAGRAALQGGQPYHLWKVVVDRPTATDSPYSWGDVDGGDKAPTPDELEARNDVGPVQPAGDHFDADTREPQPVADDDIPF